MRILALHGFTGGGEPFREWLGALPGAEILAPDLPGTEGTDLYAHMETVWNHLDAAGWDTCHLFGYSMGGRLALRLALARPQRFRTLLVESAHPGLATEAERADRRQRDAELAARIETDYPAFLEAWNRLPLFRSPETAPAAPVARFRTLQTGRDPRLLAAQLRAFGAGDLEPVTGRLGEYPMPTHVFTGALDTAYTDLWADLARRFPNWNHHVVPDAGHRVHLDAPDQYLSIIRTILTEHP